MFIPWGVHLKKITWKVFFLLPTKEIITICWVNKNQNIVRLQTNFKGWIIEAMKSLSEYSAKIILCAFRTSKQIFHVYWGCNSTGQNVNINFNPKMMILAYFWVISTPFGNLKWIFNLSPDRPNVKNAFDKDCRSISYSYLES